MTPLRLAALIVSAALIATAVPSPAAAHPATRTDARASDVSTARTSHVSAASTSNASTSTIGAAGAVSAAEARAVEVPCPIVPVTPKPPPPVVSPAPTHDPSLPVVGGKGLATTGLAVPAGSAPLPANLSAKTWVVADLDTGEVLGACDAHQRTAPASIQKLLLAATVLPKLKPTDSVTITQEDLNFEAGSSAVGLILGGTYTIETIWLGLMLNSGNDAANVLARLGGGDRGVAGTLADMNAEAKHLGAFDTHAETPSGLDGPGQATTAYDMALIARACFALADFRKYTGTRSAQIPPQPPKDPKGYQIQNDNTLLTKYPGAIGGKTGYTDLARHTYVGAAERDGRRLVVTLLNGEHLPVRLWQQGAALLDWGFTVPRGTSVGKLVEPGEAPAVVAPTPTSVSAAPAIQAVSAGGVSHRTTMMVGAGTAGALFVGVWLFVLLRTRSPRRARHKRSMDPETATRS